MPLNMLLPATALLLATASTGFTQAEREKTLMAAVLAGLLALLYGGYRGTQLILRRTLG
jgi:hypothetical protein